MVERNTKQKQIILEFLSSTKMHPTALEVFEAVSVDNQISRATVFRVLSQLTTKGIIKKISIANDDERYDYTVAEHYHFKCRKCGRVFDIDIPYQKKLNKYRTQFKIEGHEIEFYGLCKDCLK